MTRIHQTTMFLILFVFLSACTSNSNNDVREEKEKQFLQKENELLAKENELLNMKDQLDSTAIQTVEEDTTVLSTEQQPAAPKTDSAIRVGQHNFTLQWIGWEEPGNVEITHLENNKYKIVGEQKSNKNDDFVSIDGALTVLDDKRLLFEGELVSRVSYINEGKPCRRIKPLHFRATGSRKYWRLQEKESCEDGNTVDYVDIYF